VTARPDPKISQIVESSKSNPESSPTILRSQGRPELALILDYFNCPIGSDRSAEGAPRNGYRT
jgi:hypothetical protein